MSLYKVSWKKFHYYETLTKKKTRTKKYNNNAKEKLYIIKRKIMKYF